MKERNKSKFLTCAAVFFSSLIPFAGAQTLAASTVQFKLLRDYLIVIPVTVNGLGPYEFLLDTGTNTTLVGAEFARQLRLRPIDRIELVTVSGAQIVPRAQLESVAVGAKTARGLESLFSDLREVRAVKPEICGVLGQNFLEQFNYLINYREQRIEFEDGEELEKGLRGARLPIEWSEGRAIITSDGKERWRLVLDSGTATLLLFKSSERGLWLDWEQAQRVRVNSDLGSRIAQQRRLRSFNLGGANFYDLPVTLLEAKGGCAGRVEDGLLPTSFFRSIYFNHRKNYVIFNPF